MKLKAKLLKVMVQGNTRSDNKYLLSALDDIPTNKQSQHMG